MTVYAPAKASTRVLTKHYSKLNYYTLETGLFQLFFLVKADISIKTSTGLNLSITQPLFETYHYFEFDRIGILVCWSISTYKIQATNVCVFVHIMEKSRRPQLFTQRKHFSLSLVGLGKPFQNPINHVPG